MGTAGAPPGHCKLEVDGNGTSQKNRQYGVYFIGVDLKAAQTNVLPSEGVRQPFRVRHLRILFRERAAFANQRAGHVN